MHLLRFFFFFVKSFFVHNCRLTIFAQTVQRYKLQACILPTRKPVCKRIDGVAAVSSRVAVISIVQKDNVATGNVCEPLDHWSGRLWNPITCPLRPHDYAVPSTPPHHTA